MYIQIIKIGVWMEGFTSYSIKTMQPIFKKKYKLKEIRFKLPKNIGKFKGDPVRSISNSSRVWKINLIKQI